MTFSILARSPGSGALGIAIASRFFAVGAVCPFVFPGLGALSTQAYGHPPFAATAGELLVQGLEPSTIIARLLAGDQGREGRQIHLIDARGRVAAHDGREITEAAGHREGKNVSVAGNMLLGHEVLDASVEGFASALEKPFAERLLLALEAGQQAGGDSRGQQAAALVVYGAQPFPLLSLRVDDHPEAVAELRRLFEGAKPVYLPYMRGLASPEEALEIFGP